MSKEMVFRAIVMAFVLVLYASRHLMHRRARSRSPVQALKLRGVEGFVIASAWCWTVALVAYGSALPWFDLALPVPWWLRWIGVAGLAASLPLSLFSQRALGRQLSKSLEIGHGHRLVQSGPYRFVRHPIYATLFLTAIGFSLVSANALVCAGTIAVAIAFIVRIKKEEAILEARFGEAWRHYRAATGMLVPKLIRPSVRMAQ